MLKFNKEIKIVTGYSGFGGSTISLIELCNAFNRRGIECTLYGPQDFHLDKCPSGKEPRINQSDRVIYHLIETSTKPCKSAILSCHEKSYFPLNERSVEGYDCVRFVSESQREWHNWIGPNFVIPNIMEPIHIEKTGRYAGVIGAIKKRKQTHISIQRALDDGHEVMVFGPKANDAEYLKLVQPLLDNPRVQYMGLLDRKDMYEMISCVYQSSEDESASRTWGECWNLGIPFYGCKNIIPYEMWDEQQIIDKWLEVIG